MAGVGTSGASGRPPPRGPPPRGDPAPAPLQRLLQRAAAIEEELAQGGDKPFTEVIHCHSGDAVALGHQPATFLQQVAAICTYPELLGATNLAEDAQRRAGDILGHLQGGGGPGGYNLEYVTQVVAKKVARYLERRDGGISSDHRCIVPCSGTAAAMVDVLSLVADAAAVAPAGVLVPVPGPRLHGAVAALAGLVALSYPLAEERGWAVAGQELRQEVARARRWCHPKVLCVINPGDPTGHVLTRQNMEEIIQLVAEENLLLLADEVHQDRAFVPERPFLSFKRVLMEMGDPLASTVQLISFYSLSKGFGGGGFRAGFFELVNVDPGVLKSFYTWGLSVYPPIVGQLMLEVVMDPPQPGDPSYPAFQKHPQDVLQTLAHNSRLLQEKLSPVPTLSCQEVQGGPRAFPRLLLPPRALRCARELGLEPDVFFCLKLLEETGVVVAPGSHFGQAEGTQHLGLSLLLPPPKLEQVLVLLTRFYTTFLQDFS